MNGRISKDAARPPGAEAERDPAPAPGGLRSLRRGEFGSRELTATLVSYWTVAALLIVLIVFAFISPNFYTRTNWIATSLYMTGVLTLALGQSFAIISGGIDLSIAGILAFSSMAGALVMSSLIQGGVSEPAAIMAGIAAALAVGALVGVVNGLLITKLRLVPFIVTLGMLGVMRGGTNLLNGGQQVADIPIELTLAGSRIFFGWLPSQVAVAIVLTLLCGVLLAKTRFGLRTYYIGSNREGARRAGINVDMHLIKVYMIAGMIAAVAGIMMLARFGVAQTNAGEGSELSSIAAVVIGGASLFGGTGSIFGTLVGAALMSVMVTGLILAGVQPFWQTVVTGLIIIGAVYIDQLRDRLRFGAHQ